MGVYFDNAAAAPCSRETLEAFSAAQERFFANQEAAGFHGRRSLAAVGEAAEQLAEALAPGGGTRVFFMNTGTDALRAAVQSVSAGLSGNIVTTGLEHPALLRALERAAAGSSSKLLRCPVNSAGGLALDRLEELLREKTALVALHHIQSETGRIQELAAVRALLLKTGSNALLLADTIQSAGKYPIPWKEAGLDFAFVSGQKIGCPGGGAVLCRERFAKALSALRSEAHFSGRAAPASALVLSGVCRRLSGNLERGAVRARALKDAMRSALSAHGIRFRETVPRGAASDYILHILTTPYQGAILTRMLAGCGMSAAPGSACGSEAGGGSRTLRAMGLPENETFCALRLSFWHGNELAETERFAAALADCIGKY